jgi:hypothetical protein
MISIAIIAIALGGKRFKNSRGASAPNVSRVTVANNS